MAGQVVEIAPLKTAEQVEQLKAEPRAAPEKTENPTELKAPTKPKPEDFKT